MYLYSACVSLCVCPCPRVCPCLCTKMCLWRSKDNLWGQLDSLLAVCGHRGLNSGRPSYPPSRCTSFCWSHCEPWKLLFGARLLPHSFPLVSPVRFRVYKYADFKFWKLCFDSEWVHTAQYRIPQHGMFTFIIQYMEMKRCEHPVLFIVPDWHGD